MIDEGHYCHNCHSKTSSSIIISLSDNFLQTNNAPLKKIKGLDILKPVSFEWVSRGKELDAS